MSAPGRGEGSSTLIRKMLFLEENSMSAISWWVWERQEEFLGW